MSSLSASSPRHHERFVGSCRGRGGAGRSVAFAPSQPGLRVAAEAASASGAARGARRAASVPARSAVSDARSLGRAGPGGTEAGTGREGRGPGGAAEAEPDWGCSARWASGWGGVFRLIGENKAEDGHVCHPSPPHAHSPGPGRLSRAPPARCCRLSPVPTPLGLGAGRCGRRCAVGRVPRAKPLTPERCPPQSRSRHPGPSHHSVTAYSLASWLRRVPSAEPPWLPLPRLTSLILLPAPCSPAPPPAHSHTAFPVTRRCGLRAAFVLPTSVSGVHQAGPC